jgi:DNA-directed RNA polymerase specialized sigma24 family protein/CheY-like chemotaxis protein
MRGPAEGRSPATFGAAAALGSASEFVLAAAAFAAGLSAGDRSGSRLSIFFAIKHDPFGVRKQGKVPHDDPFHSQNADFGRRFRGSGTFFPLTRFQLDLKKQERRFMSLSAAIAPQLPYLRRYARALTGSQPGGDAYVRATLEAILAKPEAFEPILPPKIALYRVFHAIWSTTGGVERAAQPDGNGGASPDERLQALSPSNREALLLSSLEGFSRAETARILQKSEAEVDAQIAETQKEIERQLASRVLIIEDESIIALDLESIMKGLGHEVVGIAATRDDAVRKARAHKPGLVLADIRLADGSSGIDAVSDILGSFDVPVIFITAYPERLLTGERPEPTYLITKPFLTETVMAAVGQALFFHPAKRQVA